MRLDIARTSIDLRPLAVSGHTVCVQSSAVCDDVAFALGRWQVREDLSVLRAAIEALSLNLARATPTGK